MKKQYNTDDLIGLLAKRGRFTKGDTQVFLNVLVEILEECVKESVVLKVRGLGKLYYSRVPPRRISSYTDKFGVFHPEKTLPESRKVIFKLSENIRHSGGESVPSEDLDKDSNI